LTIYHVNSKIKLIDPHFSKRMCADPIMQKSHPKWLAPGWLSEIW